MIVALLIILLICVIILAAFAIQNTAVATVYFFTIVAPGIPIWAVVTIAAVLGAVVALLAVVPIQIRRSFGFRNTQNQVKDREKKIGELSGNISTLEADKAGLSQQIDSLNAERDQLSQQVDLLSTERDSLLARIRSLELSANPAYPERPAPPVEPVDGQVPIEEPAAPEPTSELPPSGPEPLQKHEWWKLGS